MKRFRILIPLCLTLSVVVAAFASAEPPPQTASAQKWSSDLWTSALNGDREAVDRILASPPKDALAADSGERYQKSFEQHHSNVSKALTAREEAHAKALTEMQEHVASSELSKALRAAVTAQTLSENLNAAFEDPNVQDVVAWAEEQIPKIEAERDWLLAQELLFYLRTLYEDTDHFDQYTRYDEQLDWVNRRVSLLAQYAPKRLHELRSLRAERLGEKPLGEYKPSKTNDWRERVRDIKPDMLKSSLRVASSGHIESSGWRPLLRGGLEELKILATTASLEETFEKLADPAVVGAWVAHLDEQLAKIESMKDSDFSNWTCSGILDELVRVNEQTVQLPRAVIYREFGDGAMYELDQFSEIIWPDKLSRFKQATEGAFVGVGILIKHNETMDIVVVNPLEGTPAYFGGVKPNDVISEVDGESTVGWSLNDAVDRITGEPETDVMLGLRRDGETDLIPLTLTRDVIKLRSVYGWWKKNLGADGSPSWNWYVDPVSRIAYVRLTQFTEDTYSDLLSAWNEMSAQGKPAGLILDLRYNPGGLLTSAVDISRLFVKNGVIVSGEDKNEIKAWDDQKAEPQKAILADVSTVVLINQGSASASEIVAGCLQAHGAGVIVGERSFGKGSVQTVHPVSSADKARLKLTTQYYRLPDSVGPNGEIIRGRLVHKRPGAKEWGVDPDIVVKMTPKQIEDSLTLRQESDILPQDDNGNLMPDSPDRPDVNKLLTEGFDPQLETALLLLQARALGSVSDDTRHALRN
jgi:carboxyl-terminal processing protease